MKNFLTLILILILSGTLCAQTNTFPASGNVGIGTTSPAAKLSFNNVNDGSNGADGITWHDPGPLDYAIYRTAGPWSGPDYQQLKLSFNTGIVLYPGSAYGKSYVDIQGGGLRVSSGNVGIGTTTPIAKLHVISNTNSTGDNTVKFEAPAIGSSASHVHWGTTGDWYIRSAHQSGKVIIQDYVGGNVGIGTDAPGYKLDVAGFGTRIRNSDISNNAYTTFRVQGADYANGLEIDFFGNNNMTSDLNWSYGGGAGSAAIVNVNPRPLVFGTNNQGRMLIDANGNVAIGTNDSQGYKLAVVGKAVAEEMV